MAFFLLVKQSVKFLNRLRLNFQRHVFLLVTDRRIHENYSLPVVPCPIVLISVNDRYGDLLYTIGLALALKKANYSVSIAVLPSAYPKIRNQSWLDGIYILGNKQSLDELIGKHIKIAVDMEYVNAKFWRYRYPLLKRLHCYTITTSELCKNLNLYNAFISYRSYKHISQRLAAVFNFITSNKIVINRINPFIKLPSVSFNWQRYIGFYSEIVYVNATAGDQDRYFSDEQVNLIIDVLSPWLSRSNKHVVIINSPHHDFKYNHLSNLKVLPNVSFYDLAVLISLAKLVITPDTSVTHLASMYNKPTFVVVERQINIPQNDIILTPRKGAYEA